MKLDILAIAAHPDDVELSCGGTILTHIAQGYTVGILDLTKGELGTRGTPQIRHQEATAAAQILGISARDNVGIPDGFFKNEEDHQRAIIPYIRRYRPDVVLANAIDDRHPDHGRGARIIHDACFLAGLRQIQTTDIDGTAQQAWRPKYIYNFIQDRYIKPDFIVDISEHWDKKEEAIRAFRSQFFDPNSSEPESYISNPIFLDYIKARAQEYGHAIGVRYAEGFTTARAIGINNIFALK